MKKLIAIVIAVIAVVVMALPVGAAGGGTNSVTVLSGTGDTPLVKAMWVSTNGVMDSANESADTPHAILGTQVLPNSGFQARTPVWFWAVVTDPLGVNFVQSVYADVYYPTGTYQVAYDPGNPVGTSSSGSLKYEWKLDQFTPSTTGYATPQAAFLAAMPNPVDTVNIVTVNSVIPTQVYPPGSPTNPATQQGEIAEELAQGQAKLYVGQYYMDNCELTGTYPVSINAVNTTNVHGFLASTWGLNWTALKSADFDFSGVNYGQVGIGYDKEISGDYSWSATPGVADDGMAHGATILNSGNTYLKMTVKQDDMGFGTTASTLPAPGWNVYYDARLGDIDAPTTYYPSVTLANTAQLSTASATTIPEILALCSLEKVDFSIHVIKDPALTVGNHNYSGNMILGFVNVGGPPTVGTEYDPYSTPTRPNPYVAPPDRKSVV